MTSPVEIHTMAVEYTEDTGSALVATNLSDVINGMT